SLERAWTAAQRVHAFDLVGDHAPALEAVDDLGEHIRGATDRGRVAEMLRDLAHRLSDATLGLRTRGRLASPLARERAGAEKGPGPRAEVLRAEPLSHHVLDVGVDVLPAHVDHGARVTLELEHLARMAEERAHERREAPVAKLPDLAPPRLPLEVEADPIAAHGDMARLERGDAVAPVLARVFLASRPQEARRQDSKNSREHLLALQATKLEVADDGAPHPWKSDDEAQQPLPLHALATQHLLRVVAILPAARRVPPHGLHPGSRRRMDRHVPPGRRDLESVDSLPVLAPNRPPGCRPVAETPFFRAETTDSASLETLDDGHEC